VQESIPNIMPLSSSIPQDEHTFLRIEHAWHDDLISFVQHGLPKVLGALLIAFILQRIMLFVVHRMRRRADKLVGNSQRAAQLRTAAGIIRATSYGLIIAYIVLQTLAAIGVPLGPFIASAGVIGLGISFGAQSIFKDVLNGIFILIEDQYNVGDTVKIAGLQGAVEDLTLRCTTLRDGDGTVYIVPNSQIATVSNLSRDFSVASLTVSVDAAADPDRVIAVLGELAAGLRSDEAFQQVMIDQPSVLGVDKINGREVNYLVNLRVRANQRDGVLRELRRRVLQRFERENIPLGTAVSTLIMPRPDPTAPPKPS
jgi:small-conductance mechanosensitive channel